VELNGEKCPNLNIHKIMKQLKSFFYTVLAIVAILSFIGIGFFVALLLIKKGYLKKFLKIYSSYDKKFTNVSSLKNKEAKTAVMTNSKKLVVRPSNITKRNVIGKESLFNERQESLINLFKERKSMTMSEVEPLFKGITNRTLRRDLSKLEEKGIVKQEGKTKNSVYVYIS
jgi:predicted HTH transcriptional regulator